MLFGFGKKDKNGQRGKGRSGRGFRLGKKKAASVLEQQNIKCICPECGWSVSHQQRVQCFKLKCPRCGSKMTRRF